MHPFLKGFIVGLCAGAAAALLLTPHKGTENRAIVRYRVQRALETGKQAAAERDEQLRARFRQAIGHEEKEPTPS